MVYVAVGTWSVFPHKHASYAIVFKPIINFIIFVQYKLSYFFLWIITQMYLTVSGSMEPIKVNKFVVVRSWWRVEAGYDCALNKIP